MVILVTYDVNIAQENGTKRLRKVAKLCERYGIRVQNSVFEVSVSSADFVILKAELLRTIDAEKDSIRFYKLGNNYKTKIETIGKLPLIQTGEPLLL